MMNKEMGTRVSPLAAQSDSGPFVRFIATLLTSFLLMVGFWLLGCAIMYGARFFFFVRHADTQDWALIGDVARNGAGLSAVVAAGITGYIVHRTSVARAKEASSANFRDHMQWAVDKLSLDGGSEATNMVDYAFANSVIQHYAEKKPKYLSAEEHQLVLNLQETLVKMQELRDFDQ